MTDRFNSDKRATYRIQIQGIITESWSAYLGNMEINKNTDKSWPVTTLLGSLQNQAELLGVLNSLYDLGYPLLYVECQYPSKEKFRIDSCR